MHATPILIVVNNVSDWPLQIEGVELVEAKKYLTEQRFSEMKGVRVFNLCRSYRYQSVGYYVSLLAAARGHKPLPGVSTLVDIKLKNLIRHVSDDLDDLIQKSLHPIQPDHFTLSIYFGHNLAKKYERLSLQLFKMFQAPFLRAYFVRREGEWELKNISPISASEIPEEHVDFVVEVTRQFISGRRKRIPAKTVSRYDLAILVNPSDPMPPSDGKALKKFARAAEHLGMGVEFIEKDDFGRIAEFDGLFIRETTNVNHYTYKFARKAAAEGLVVIDDPVSILKCTNKVYLAELMQRHRIRTPKTVIGHRNNIPSIGKELGFPVILKEPDSSFSQGVVKVRDEEELRRETEKILARSELFIAQEYLPTEYDWRIGILNRQLLFACRYYMAPDHWQIQGRDERGRLTYGGTDVVPPEEVPGDVIKTALRAANLIGDGLYGVDMKFTGNRSYLIEINDNPSMDSNSEDKLLHDELYHIVMEEFLNRIRRRAEGRHENGKH